jgi:argininosuccinate synthase
MPKVALAYTGRLDTDICLSYLRNVLGMKVITFSANIGQPEVLEPLAERAVRIGAYAAHLADLRERFVREFIFPAVRADAVYQGRTPLFAALARPPIVEELVRIAREEGAGAIAHGSHGIGNDVVRFETLMRDVAPEIKILAPLRELGLNTSAEEIEYARTHSIAARPARGFLHNAEQNLWGANLRLPPCDPWDEAPRDARVLTVPPAQAPSRPTTLELELREGVPVGLDGEEPSPVALIERLTKLGGRAGVGWSDVIEDRIRPQKSREIYEEPAAAIIDEARRALEALVLEKEARQMIGPMGARYAELVYEGRWFSSLRRSMDRFFEELNRPISGKVRMQLSRGRIEVLGVRSPHARLRP